MFLLALIWILIGAAMGWRLGSRRSTSQALAQARQQMGREDVISIVPHIAAQQRFLTQDRKTDTP